MKRSVFAGFLVVAVLAVLSFLGGNPTGAEAGQSIKLPERPLSAIYIAACASEALEAGFEIAYSDGTTQARPLSVPAWNVLQPGAPVALHTPILRGAEGDVQAPAYIYLLRIADIATSATPAALVLPNAPEVKVFAVTVEH